MPRRPKNRNSVKLKALKLLDSASPASSVAAKVRVHRSTIYRWKKKQVQLTKAKAPRAETVDVMQGSSVNGFRASVFLAASATGNKLPPLIVYAGVPGGPVSQENAYIWKPSVLKTHKMASVRRALEERCCTQVEFVPPGVTGVSQPMDVAVMKPFKDYVNFYTLLHSIRTSHWARSLRMLLSP
eukprot:jgi/Phyca11/14693/fgenesh1_pg.PHYCAscaffold_9_\